MKTFRTICAMILGAAAAGLALRVRAESQRRDSSIGEVLADLPQVLADDVSHVSASARAAVRDGSRAAQRARVEIEQLARSTRPTKGQHD